MLTLDFEKARGYAQVFSADRVTLRTKLVRDPRQFVIVHVLGRIEYCQEYALGIIVKSCATFGGSDEYLSLLASD